MSDTMRRLQELADSLTTEADPNYKTEWERGFDYGMEAAGRSLRRILDAES
jgi:hypothetical protein